MEDEHIHDPFQFEYIANTRKFSLGTKVMAIVLVLIFISIPLYEISPEAFQLNHVIEYVQCSPYVNCGCFF